MTKPGHSARHGHTSSTGGVKWCSPTYKAWSLMVDRCTNPRNASWASHGGRGITVYDRWRSFENFLFDMGDRPPGLTLERVDNEHGYSLDNCVWATWKQQGRNRRTNRQLQLGDRTMCVAEWAEYLGVNNRTILARLRRGWPVERVLA